MTTNKELRQENNILIQGSSDVAGQAVSIIDGLKAAADIASGVQMGIDIKMPKAKETLILGAVYNNCKTPQVRIDQYTAPEIIEDILSVFGCQHDGTDANVHVVYIAYGKLLREVLEMVQLKYTDPVVCYNAVLEAYGLTGIKAVSYPDSHTINPADKTLGITIAEVQNTIRDIIHERRGRRTQIEIPEFLSRR